MDTEQLIENIRVALLDGQAPAEGETLAPFAACVLEVDENLLREHERSLVSSLSFSHNRWVNLAQGWVNGRTETFLAVSEAFTRVISRRSDYLYDLAECYLEDLAFYFRRSMMPGGRPQYMVLGQEIPDTSPEFATADEGFVFIYMPWSADEDAPHRILPHANPFHIEGVSLLGAHPFVLRDMPDRVLAFAEHLREQGFTIHDGMHFEGVNHPLYASAPEGHWMHGRGVVALWANLIRGQSAFREWITPVLEKHAPLRPAIDLDPEIESGLDIVRTVLGNFGQLNLDVETKRARATQLKAESDNFLRQYGTYVRQSEDLQQEIKHDTRSVVDRAIEMMTNVISLPEQLQTIPAIRSVSVDDNCLKVVTYPYVMDMVDPEREEDEDGEFQEAFEVRVMIPSLRFKYDLREVNLAHALRITNAATGSNAEHPHITGGLPCWGGAGSLVTDQWARRDWESLVRTTISWMTRYNPSSPYWRAENARDHGVEVGEDMPLGWITDEGVLAELEGTAFEADETPAGATEVSPEPVVEGATDSVRPRPGVTLNFEPVSPMTQITMTGLTS